jgi:hypothetical protein
MLNAVKDPFPLTVPVIGSVVGLATLLEFVHAIVPGRPETDTPDPVTVRELLLICVANVAATAVAIDAWSVAIHKP